MKLAKKLTAILLCVATSLTVLLPSSCKKKQPDSESAQIIEKPENKNHYHNVKDTEEFFMQNGHCDYKILLPEMADNYLKTAASDFNLFFQKATGQSIAVVYDNKVDYNSGKFISVGNTKLFKESGLVADESLTTSGFIIKSINDDIFIGSHTTKSAMFGMQELLSYLIDWEYYGTDCYDYNTNVKNIKLQTYDIREVADIEYRYTNYGYLVKSGYSALISGICNVTVSPSFKVL